MDKSTLAGLKDQLDDYLKPFADCFRSKPSEAHMAAYVRGQLGALGSKAIEPIALEQGIKPRTLQQFISCHQCEAAMRTTVRQIVARDHFDPNAIAVIDETSFEKKGKKTVGVQRQWCGHLGKMDNCVQTVHLTYVARDFATIVDSDLYLPESWTKDKALRRMARIPASVTFRTKLEIAVELLERTKKDGVSLRWLTADEYYGHSSAFLARVEALGLHYVVEVLVL